MRGKSVFLSVLFVSLAVTTLAQNTTHNPTWWDKYQFLAANGPDPSPGATSSLSVTGNVDVSNECGPQSETFIAINPSRPTTLAGGSNEIFRDPMRGYFSSDSGATWGGVDLPLPPPKGNGTDFGSDPGLAFDTRGNVDAITEDVVAVDDHVAEIDTDPELETAVRRDGVVDGASR